jgi:general stress protein YciG
VEAAHIGRRGGEPTRKGAVARDVSEWRPVW